MNDTDDPDPAKPEPSIPLGAINVTTGSSLGDVESQSQRPASRTPLGPSRSSSISRSRSTSTESNARNISATMPKRQILPQWLRGFLHNQFGWIPPKMTVRAWKPVMRSAIATWISLLLVIIPRTGEILGQASFLILVGALISPPNEPFIAIARREFTILLAIALAWSWSCLGILFAHVARNNRGQTLLPSAVKSEDMYNGKYVEASSSAILLTFLCLGGAFFCYLKARLGPGPYVFATVFGCITICVNFTSAALFPYANYQIGEAVMVPLAIHSGISIVCSALVFPESVNAQYTKRLISVFKPLSQALRSQLDLFKISPLDEDFDPKPFADWIAEAETALVPLQASAELLKRDFSFGKYSGEDLKAFREYARRITVRSDGLAFFFRIIDPLRERFPLTPVTSRPASLFTRASLDSLPPSPLAVSSPLSESVSRAESPSVSGTTTPLPSPSHPRLLVNDNSAPALVPSPSRSANESAISVPALHTSHNPLRNSIRRRVLTHHVHLPAANSFPRFPNMTPLTLSLAGSHIRSRLHLRPPSLFQERISQGMEQDVGLFESQRYMNIEAGIHVGRGDEYVEKAVSLLGVSSSPLIEACADAADTILGWLERNNKDRYAWLKSVQHTLRESFSSGSSISGEKTESSTSSAADTEAEIKKSETNISGKEPTSRTPAEALALLKSAFERFNGKERLQVLEPYVTEENVLRPEYPPHRYLFQCFVYQFHLLEVAKGFLELLEEVKKLDESRTQHRVWGPSIGWHTFIQSLFTTKTTAEGAEPEDDNPEDVRGVNHREPHRSDESRTLVLEDAQARDPDALPPSSALEYIGARLFAFFSSFGRGNLLFAVKAGILTGLISLPAFMSSTAGLAYHRKWLWAIIMAQLTIARFKGETALNFGGRIIATFFGGLVGVSVWYLASGSGLGNAYGLAAVTAVVFPPLLFFRLYYDGPPVTTLLTSTTIALIIGYSWKDNHNPPPSTQGYGFQVGWRRFVFVSIGVTAAFIFSFLPPATTIRRYQRFGQAAVTLELGSIFCSIVSFATLDDKDGRLDIHKDLIYIRSKIRKFKAQSQNAQYELSLRGRWPAKRYAKIISLQLEIAYLLSHVYLVITRLQDSWKQAFLGRARLLDAEFIGSVLSTMSMCSSSLRNGTPLPQISVTPLIDRYMKYQMGLAIHSSATEVDYGLPRKITPEVLADEQYMCFTVGLSCMYGILFRLDRLALAVKELVGENFHIDGIDLTHPHHTD